MVLAITGRTDCLSGFRSCKSHAVQKIQLPGFKTQILRIKQGIEKTEEGLKVFQVRKEKLKKDGLI